MHIYIYIYICTHICICMYVCVYVCMHVCMYAYIYIYIMETGWSPLEGHPYYSMVIIILLSDIKHLISNFYSWGALPMVT